MSDVFISYSRKDKVFARRLFERLGQEKLEGWADWEGITGGEDWWRKICTAIDSALTVVIIISPDALSSKYCNLEIERARKNNKRILPILRREPDVKLLAGEWFGKDWEETARQNYAELYARQFVSFRKKPGYECHYDETRHEIVNPECDGLDSDADDFETAFRILLNDVRKDPEYLSEHRRLLVRAGEWEARRGGLLSRDELPSAEAWLAGCEGKDTQPTELHRLYINASRKALDQQRRLVVTALVFGLLFTSILAGVALVQTGVANDNLAAAQTAQFAANRRADEAQSISLALAARDVHQQDDPMTALALALDANRIAAPPALAQRTLAEFAYEPGRRKVFGQYSSAAISPDGRTALFGSEDGSLTLTNLETGEVLVRRQEYASTVDLISISPTGQSAVTSSSIDGLLHVWSFPDLSLVREVNPGTNQLGWGTFVEFSPDGSTAIINMVANQHTVINTLSGEITEAAIREGIQPISYAPLDNGQIVGMLSGEDVGGFEVWEADGGKSRFRYEVNTEGYNRNYSLDTRRFFDISPDGNLFVFAECSTFFRYVVGSYDPIPEYECVSYTVHAWNTRTEPWERLYTDLRIDGEINGLRFLPAENPFGIEDVLAVERGGLTFYNVPSFVEIHNIPNFADAVFSFGGGSILSQTQSYDPNLGTTSPVSLWDIDLGTVLYRRNLVEAASSYDFPPYSIDYDRLGEFALLVGYNSFNESGYFPGRMILWDVRAGETVHSFADDEYGLIYGAVLSPDGHTALSVAETDWWQNHPPSVIQLWTIPDGDLIGRVVPTVPTYISSLAYRADGAVAALGSCKLDDQFECREYEILLLDVEQQRILRTYRGHHDIIAGVTFSPDGRYLASAGSDGLSLWDVDNATRLWVQAEIAPTQLEYMPDGSRIVARADTGLYIVDASTGTLIERFTQDQFVNTKLVGLSPDGSWIAVHNAIIDSSSGEVLRQLNAERTMALSPSGRDILATTCVEVSDFDGLCSKSQVIRWRVDNTDQLISWTLQNRSIGVLSCDQGEVYGTFSRCNASNTPDPTSTRLRAATEPFTSMPPLWTPIASPTASEVPTGTPVD